MTLPGIRLFAVWHRNFLVWQKFFFPSIAGNLGEPLVVLMSVYLGFGSLIKQVEGVPYVAFVAPGLVMGSSMYGATLEATYNAFTRLEIQKTWTSIVSTPVSIEEVVMGEWLWATTKGWLSGTCVMLVMLVFGFVPITAIPGIMLASLMAASFFAGTALMATSVAPSYDFFNFYLTGFIAPMYFFGGVFFPLDALPAWAKAISSFLPLSAAIDASRGSALGHPELLLVFVKALLLPAGGLCFAMTAAFLSKKRLMK